MSIEKVELIYCATPSRFKERMDEVMDFVNKKTPYAPFHPFKAFPWDLFEGNPKVGRENAMEYCIRSVKLCDRFGLFGISQGTVIQELPIALKENKPIDLFLEFDPEWRNFYEKFLPTAPYLKDILKNEL